MHRRPCHHFAATLWTMALPVTSPSRLQGQFETHVAFSTLTASGQWSCVHTHELKDSGCMAIVCCSLMRGRQGDGGSQRPAEAGAPELPSSILGTHITEVETGAGVSTLSADPQQLGTADVTGAEAAISESCFFSVPCDTRRRWNPHTVLVPLRASASISSRW